MRFFIFALFIALIGYSAAYFYDSDDVYPSVDVELPKRSLDRFWRNIHLQMPGRQGSGQKRTASLSRASANVYYRLG